MITEHSDKTLHYDAERALCNAGDIPAIRDQLTNGVLELFSDGGDLAALFDVSLYRSNPTQSRVLTHRAIALAKQGAMPSLELQCEKIKIAIKSGRFAVAEELGRELPTIIAALRTAVLSEHQS